MRIKSIINLLSLILIVSLLLFNCSKDDNDNDIEEVSTMTAVIDGTSFSALEFAFNIISDTITSVIGWSGNEYLGFNLMNATTTGTYDVSLLSPNTATYSDDDQTSFYTSRQGSVEVTVNNENKIAGSFECILVKASTSDTILVDNGSFDVLKSE